MYNIVRPWHLHQMLQHCKAEVSIRERLVTPGVLLGCQSQSVSCRAPRTLTPGFSVCSQFPMLFSQADAKYYCPVFLNLFNATTVSFFFWMLSILASNCLIRYCLIWFWILQLWASQLSWLWSVFCSSFYLFANLHFLFGSRTDPSPSFRRTIEVWVVRWALVLYKIFGSSRCFCGL